MPLEVGFSGMPSKNDVGVYLGLVAGEDLSDVNTGELVSDCKGEFSATRKSSNRISAQKKHEGVTIDKRRTRKE